MPYPKQDKKFSFNKNKADVPKVEKVETPAPLVVEEVKEEEVEELPKKKAKKQKSDEESDWRK